MKILVINAGSSSLKYQLLNMEDDKVLAKGSCTRIGIDGSNIEHKTDSGKVKEEVPMKNHEDAIKVLFEKLTSKECGVISSMDEIDAVGHRVLHGGEAFSASVIIDEEVKQVIRDCIPLGPLHNPANLMGIEACEKMMPGVPQVAVFDTAFHHEMPKKAYLYALPYKYYEKYKIRRYGFHGSSHRYVSMKAAELMGKPIEDCKIITMHLGAGSSIAAVKGGHSVDTSMGFTPLAGFIMGTRCGDIDPAIVPYLMEKENMTPQQMDHMLNKESGILGVSEMSSDFRDIEIAGAEGNERAQLCLDMFSYSVKKYIGYYAAAMGGVDAIVFTAGVGEHNPLMRQEVCDGLDFMGIKIDKEKNACRGKLVDASAPDSKVKVYVIPTNEELMIATDTAKLVSEK